MRWRVVMVSGWTRAFHNGRSSRPIVPATTHERSEMRTMLSATMNGDGNDDVGGGYGGGEASSVLTKERTSLTGKRLLTDLTF